jgi:hypothetical protein
VNLNAFAPLDARTYARHELHGPGRAWTESNCYIDVWIEILHSLGLDPYACLPHVLPVDFEADQWTFFKPSHDDLFALYGLDVHELNVWRPLIENVRTQIAAGRMVITEVDAFLLPDTAGTDYRVSHTKTTIGIQRIDVQERVLGYYHNSSYHELGGADFAEIFRLDRLPDPSHMPFFAEFVRIDRRKRLEEIELVRESIRVLVAHLERRPRTNPVNRFKEKFGDDIAWIHREGLAAYHAWAFATLRQLGAAFELAGLYVGWLGRHGEAGLEPARQAFENISGSVKALVLKTARSANTKKPLDAQDLLGGAERSWDLGMDLLVARYGG